MFVVPSFAAFFPSAPFFFAAAAARRVGFFLTGGLAPRGEDSARGGG